MRFTKYWLVKNEPIREKVPAMSSSVVWPPRNCVQFDNKDENALREKQGEATLDTPKRRFREEEKQEDGLQIEIRPPQAQVPSQARRTVVAPTVRRQADPSVQAEFDKLPPGARVPVGEGDTPEAAIERHKASQIEAGRDKTEGDEDKSQKYSAPIKELVANLNDPNSDIRAGKT